MIAALALAALAVAPGVTTDDDPIIIGPEFVELFVTMPDAEPMCTAYGGVIDAIDGLGMDYSTSQIFVDAADAMILIAVEGDGMRFDNEARDVFTDWLHTDCS